jgi:bacillithiol system protein YtxJ
MKAQFIQLNSIDQLDELFEVSKTKPITFFKHSITCPISANVFEEVANVDSTIFLIVVQDSRDISNAIARKTGIKHESPQAIVIKKGEPVFHASHYDITSSDLTATIAHSRVS